MVELSRSGREALGTRRAVKGGANVVLVGFMGAGKSEVGRRLARRLRRPFVDADEIIAVRAGCSIPEIFRREGEPGFRARERDVIRQLAGLRGAVIATGGGAVASPENWDALAEAGVMVWLKAPLDVLLARAGLGAARDRPMLARDPEEVAALYQAREPYYARAHFTVNTEQATPDEVAEGIARVLAEHGLAEDPAPRAPGDAAGTGGQGLPAPALTVPLGERSYPIWVGAGLLTEMGALLRRVGVGSRLLVVTQPVVERLYGATVMDSLRDAGFRAHLAVIPDGEDHKTLATVAGLYDEAVRAGLDRSSAVVALGGGVLGDIAGMVAGTYMRGIDFVQVPTTLLAQVDAAVGGKVGVNLPQGKNLVGVFHQPRAVVVDTNTLLSLPDREFAAGMAEVVKYGFIADPALLERLEARADRILARDLDELAFCVIRSCEIKADIVRQDEREAGIRAWLNFGHTFAHGIEAAGDYRRHLHGEAVSIGMVAALRLSAEQGWLSAEDVERGEGLLARLGLPLHGEDIDPEAAWEAMGHDKKARDGRMRLVLLRGWGDPVVTADVPAEAVRRALRSVCGPRSAPGPGVPGSGEGFPAPGDGQAGDGGRGRGNGAAGEVKPR